MLYTIVYKICCCIVPRTKMHFSTDCKHFQATNPIIFSHSATANQSCCRNWNTIMTVTSQDTSNTHKAPLPFQPMIKIRPKTFLFTSKKN